MKNRLPEFSAILSVYAVISSLIYGWTLVIFLWKLPSWILFLTISEIMVLLAYSLTSALMESLAVLGTLLLASALLPPAWMRDLFVARGTFTAITGLGAIMLYLYQYASIGYDFINELIPWSLAALGLTLLVAFLAGRIRLLVRTAAWISDLLTIFVYVSVPASLVSLLIVLYRNLF